MRPPWPYRDVAIALPIALAEAMFARAEQYDVDRGGRFDRRSGCVLIWSTSAVAGESGEPARGRLLGALAHADREPCNDLAARVGSAGGRDRGRGLARA